MSYTALRRGRRSLACHAYNVTFVTAGRRALFADFALGRLVARELTRLGQEGVVTSFAWVVMPDHVHWLFTLNDVLDLSEAVARAKGRSARTVNLTRGETGRVWQPGFYDHGMRVDADIRKAARYIVANPIRAGLAVSVGEYPLWDAAWL